MSNIKTNIHNIPKLHFILPGGGLRGAFQAGFIHRLFTYYKESFRTVRVDGTSIGALNGLCIATNNIRELYDFWYNLKSLEQLFNKDNNCVLLGDIISIYNGYYSCGIHNSNKLYKHIKKMYNNTSNFYTKYGCVVTNIDTGCSEHINHTDKNILSYITASASPWIYSKPIKINDSLYTDGGLLETYPIKYINNCNADITVILGHDNQWDKYVSGSRDNILEYIENLFTLLRYNSKNIDAIRKLVKRSDIVTINNTFDIEPLDYDIDKIRSGLHEGSLAADAFFNKYLNFPSKL